MSLPEGVLGKAPRLCFASQRSIGGKRQLEDSGACMQDRSGACSMFTSCPCRSLAAGARRNLVWINLGLHRRGRGRSARPPLAEVPAIVGCFASVSRLSRQRRLGREVPTADQRRKSTTDVIDPHSDSPALRNACSYRARSSGREARYKSLTSEARKAGLSWCTRAIALCASSMRPAIAQLAANMRIDGRKFGFSRIDFCAQDSAAS